MKKASFLNNPYFYISLFLILNISASIFYVSPNFKIAGDAFSYRESIKYLEGQTLEGPLPLNRLITTPLLLVSAAAIDFVVNNPFASLAIINFIFYILVALVFYKFAFEIYKDQTVSLLATILFTSNYYIINLDNLFIADQGGRFFFILGTYWAVKYFLSHNKKYFYYSVLAASVGVLFKEFGALGLISLVGLIIISKFSWKEKIKSIIQAGFLFSILPLLFHLFFYFKFHFSYLDWFNYWRINPADAKAYGIATYIKVLGWVYLAGWPMFLWGLWQEKKFFNKERFAVLVALLPASLSFFIWAIFTQRTVFVLVPWLSLITGFGLAKIKNKYIVALLIVFYLAVNYNLERLLVLINLPF